MKRKSFIVILCILLTLALSACGGKGKGGSSATASATAGDDIKDATTIHLWTFVELHMKFYQDAANRWNKEHPDKPIKLVAETYPYDQMHNNLLLALQSGKGAPDIADIEIGRFPNFLQGEPQLLPMNKYVEPVLNKAVKSRFDIYSKDGKYYGIPTHVGATVMYYNKEIMDEAGVDIDSIKTWDDYVKAGKQVVAKTGKMMTTVHTGDMTQFSQMYGERGSDVIDADGNLTINRKENVETLQMLHDWVYKDKIAELTPGGEPHAEEYYAYMNDGKAASISMPIWYMGRFTDYMPDLKGKMVIRPLPAWTEGGNRSVGIGGTGTVVTNQTKHAQLAQDFLAYAKLTKEANIRIWQVLGFDPVRWDVWDSPEIKEDNEYYQYFGKDIFDTLLDIKDEINGLHTTKLTPDVTDEINTNTLVNVLRNDKKSPQEALDAAQKAVEDKNK